MKNKYRKYRKYVFFLDRFPYIVFLLVVGLTIFLFINVDQRIDLSFFGAPAAQAEASPDSVVILSPEDDQVFDLADRMGTVPIEISAPEFEGDDYNVLVIIDGQVIHTFASPPFVFDWIPEDTGEYQLVAEIEDSEGQLVAVSETITFLVDDPLGRDGENMAEEELEIKKTRILAEKTYRTGNDAGGRPIFSYKCVTPPAIDGHMQDWESYEEFSSFVPTIKNTNYTGHSDIGGSFYSCWDDQNFYFAIQVTDDVYSQNFSGSQLNNGDCVVIVWDTEPKLGAGMQFLNSTNYQIEFSAGNFTSQTPEAFLRWPAHALPRETLVDASRLSSGYIIEAAVPWKTFNGYAPGDEQILGFTVSILDTDHLQSTELVVSSSVNFDFNDVSTLGNLVLVDTKDVLVLDQA